MSLLINVPIYWCPPNYTKCLQAVFNIASVVAYYPTLVDCGPYGFVCERNNRIRLCEAETRFGPAFLCPPNTICSEESSDVCVNIGNFIDSSFTRTIRCHRNERIADVTVPDCKGYILCIPNKNRFQGIKFKCSGNTIFNGYTRTCSAPNMYKCPIENTTKKPELFDSNRKNGNRGEVDLNSNENSRRTIDCKNYKFTVTQDQTPAKATYFCPSRPVRGESSVRCTIFSNQFCITLERDNEEQFISDNSAVYRRPRM